MVFYTTAGGSGRSLMRARRVVKQMQVEDSENTYLCPFIALSYLAGSPLSFDDKMTLRLDLMCICDEVVVVGDDITEEVERELDFADSIGMAVRYID